MEANSSDTECVFACIFGLTAPPQKKNLYTQRPDDSEMDLNLFIFPLFIYIIPLVGFVLTGLEDPKDKSLFSKLPPNPHIRSPDPRVSDHAMLVKYRRTIMCEHGRQKGEETNRKSRYPPPAKYFGIKKVEKEA